MTAFPQTIVPRTTIGKLAIWLDANNPSGDTTWLADGSGVETWADAVGNTYPVVQATADSRPTFQTNELGGKPVLRGDGIDDFLRNSSFSELNSTDFTIIAVARNNNAEPPTVEKIFELSNGTTSGLIDIRYLQTAEAVTFNSNGTTIGRVGIVTTDYNIFSVYKSGTTIGFAVNSSSFATATDSSTITGIDTLTVFGNRLGGQLLEGEIAEILIWKNALPAAQTTSILTYLSNKYGIAIS